MNAYAGRRLGTDILEDTLGGLERDLEKEILKIALTEGYVTPNKLNKMLPYNYPIIISALKRLTRRGYLYKIERGIYIPNCIVILGSTLANGSIDDS